MAGGEVFEIKTFGSLLVTHQGDVIDNFLSIKAAILLCYLAVQREKQSRDKLASVFWSDTSDAQALKNLRTVLSNLRQLVPDILIIERERVGLNDAVWVDAIIFENGYEKILAGADISVEEMSNLANLYKDEFLAYTSVRKAAELETWIQNKRQMLHDKYLQLLYRIVGRCMDSSQFYQGIDYARRMVTFNPFWEAAHRQLMLLLVYINQHGEALMQYERLVAFLKEELDTEPEQETITLYEKIKAHEVAVPVRKEAKSIVLPDIPYVVPSLELETISAWLKDRTCQLVTITGIAGTGKTMLASYIAHVQQAYYQDGVVIVPLHNVKTGHELQQVLISYLDVPIKSQDYEALIIERLQEEEMLLVLDNYEQILPNTSMIEAIIKNCPYVQIVVSSQMPLSLKAERVLRLTGFSGDAEDKNDAIRLFRMTAERLVYQFDWKSQQAIIAEICQELDGLPLAIVIAASQVRYLSLEEILTSLRENFQEMGISYQDMPERHQSFRNLIYACFKNISDEELHALKALSIFRGSFEHKAALAVANISMPLFIRLVDKSLIQRLDNFRYTLHGILRRVLWEDFQSLPDKEIIRERFTSYYQAWSSWLYEQRLPRNEDMRVIGIEHPNIWHLDMLGDEEKERYLLELIPSIRTYWLNRGFFDEVLEILEAAIKNPIHPADLRARAMLEMALILISRGGQERAWGLSEEAMKLSPENLYIEVQALQIMARVEMQRGQYQQARELLENVSELESHKNRSNDRNIELLFIGNYVGLGLILRSLGEIELARANYNIALQAWKRLAFPPRLDVLNNLALLDVFEGKYAEASEKFEEVIRVAEEQSDLEYLMAANGNLGSNLVKMGRYKDAFIRLKVALELGRKLKRIPSLLYQLDTLTKLSYSLKEYTIAIQIHGFIVKAYEEQKLAAIPESRENLAQEMETAKSVIGGQVDTLFQSGSKLSLEAAINLAMTLEDCFGKS